jgi:hypothetical protein
VTGGYPLQAGLEIEETVHRALSLEPEVESYLRDLMVEKYGVAL